MDIREIDIFNMEQTIWLGVKPVGVSAYDFSFEPLFSCRRPYELPENGEIIARLGAFENYQKSYDIFSDLGFKLVNNVKQHYLASELSEWYPLIQSYTPRSVWYDEIPKVLRGQAHYTINKNYASI